MVKSKKTSEAGESMLWRVLVVEDDEPLNNLAQKSLREAGYDTEGVLNGADAIERVISNPGLVLLLDIRLPDMTGSEVISTLMERNCPVPFIVMTGFGDERTAVDMMKLGATDYLVKDLRFVERLADAFGRMFHGLENEQRLRAAEEDLKRSERLLNETGRLAKIGGWEIDLATMTPFFTEETYRIYGLPATDPPPPVEEGINFYAPEARSAIQKAVQGTIVTGEPFNLELPFDTDAGDRILVRSMGQAQFEGEKAVRLYGTIQDITEQKRAEEALRESEERYRAVTHTALDAIIVVDNKGTIISWNQGASNIFGYKDEEILGRPLTLLIPKRYHDRHKKGIERVTAGGQQNIIGRSIELFGLRKDGNEFPLDLSLSTWEIEQGIFYTGIIRDITDRKRGEEERQGLFEQVVESKTKLEALSSQLVMAQETERRHIARELHDEIGQEFTAISIQLGILHDAYADTPLGTQLSPIAEMVDTSLKNIRNLSRELHPTILDDLGLVPALRWLLKRQASLGGFSATIDDTRLAARLAANVEIVCYRIVQEALTNIMKHAQASKVELELAEVDKELHIKIRDNGCGFDVEAAIKKATLGESMGILSMEERASLIGGKLEFTSEISVGTIIKGFFPLIPIEENNE